MWVLGRLKMLISDEHASLFWQRQSDEKKFQTLTIGGEKLSIALLSVKLRKQVPGEDLIKLLCPTLRFCVIS
jgi:hypothetical protein